MANVLVKQVCPQCAGDGLFHPHGGVELPCNWPGCNATGYIELGYIELEPSTGDLYDRQQDLYDRQQDILDKLDDILELLQNP